MKGVFATLISLWAMPVFAGPLVLIAEDQARLEFAASEILIATTTPDYAGNPAVGVTFGPDAALRLEYFTVARVGEEIRFLVCDVEITRPRILSVISGGSLEISGLVPDEVVMVVSILNNPAGCNVPGS